MTAEVAIMNKKAVALAADSAVSINGGKKVFQSAEKLFSLSSHQPVGIMIYGSPDFMGVPWETIVKVYRAKLGARTFGRLEGYVEDFVRFLGEGNPLFPEERQAELVAASMRADFDELRKEIEQQTEKRATEAGKSLDPQEIERIVDGVIEDVCSKWESYPDLADLPADYTTQLDERYAEVVERAREEVFKDIPLSEASRNRLGRACALVFSKEIFPKSSSGVVIAGFGESEPFPSVVSLEVEAVVGNRLKYAKRDHDRITFDCSSSIVPFAQHDMMSTFVTGVEPGYQRGIEKALSGFLGDYREKLVGTLEEMDSERRAALLEKWRVAGEEMLGEFHDCMANYRQETFISPVLDAVAALPKLELAVMAEALVNITSFKRRISLEAETVGGSVDVALISKGDGFVWVRRKQYFRPELNPQLAFLPADGAKGA